MGPPGAPLDAYRAPATGAASRYRRDGPLRVAVVGNDPEMDAETAEAAAAYRDAGAAVTEHAELPRRELADLFGGGPGVLHFVGHCDEGGLRCPDGTLALDDLPSNEVETFFLNACGSYREGLALVRSGSVAGTVTTRDVLEGQATTVGAAFARLLTRGFFVERATRLARQQVLMGTDYLAVGAAARAPVGREPSVYRVDPVEAGYRVVHEAPPDTEPGGTCRAPAGIECDCRPPGTDRVATLGRAALRELLARVGDPVMYDGDLTRRPPRARLMLVSEPIGGKLMPVGP